MIEKTYTLTVREVPKSVNSKGGGVGQHWGSTHSDKRAWEGKYLAELMVAKVRRHMTYCRITIDVKWKRFNHQETENYRHPIVKPLLDALVKGGYLPDDADEYQKVADLTFSYPEKWPFDHPGLKAYMDITLEARYE